MRQYNNSLQIKSIRDLHAFVQIYNEIEGKTTKFNRILDYIGINSSENRMLHEFQQIKKRMPIQFNFLLYKLYFFERN